MKTAHYLLTLSCGGPGYLHAYAMTNKPKDHLERVRSLMVTKIEEIMGTDKLALIFLETGPLDAPAVKQIRAHLRKVSPETAKLLKMATDSHLTVWSSPLTGPDVDWLMKMH